MDKVKNFLERYCEWLALAVAALFLGWTVYGYVVEKPVKSTVGSTPDVSPGEIGDKVWEDKGKALQAQTTSTGVPTEGFLPKINYPEVIRADLGAMPSTVVMDFKHPYLPYAPTIIEAGPSTDQNKPDLNNNRVVELPSVPAPYDLALSHGHSYIQPPGAELAKDKNWVTVGGEIPVALLAKSFDTAKIPPIFSPVAIYRVYALREEKDTSGKWGNLTTMEPLDIATMLPLPPVNCKYEDRKVYKEWAETQANVVQICEPPFYAVVPGHGSVWYEPGTKDPNETDTQTVTDVFDPKNPLAFKGDPNTLLPDEKQIYDEAKAKQAIIESRKSRPQGNTPTPAPTGTNPGRGASTGRHAVPTGGPGGQGNLLSPPDYARRRQMPNNPQQPFRPPSDNNPGNGGSVASAAPLPQGSFSPAERLAAAIASGARPDIKVWVHDVTVQAGKTYRYKLRYVISNPVAGTTNLCKNSADADVAYLTSADSKWSDEINVESDTNFYAIDNKHGIRFDIFKWNKGVWQKQTVQANPGDRVGSTEAAVNDPTKTDFDTGWTLVDVRDDPAGNSENKIIVLVSDTGAVKQKQISIDRQSERYRQLLKEVATQAEKTAQR
jgi:hypothetical protein